MTPQQAYQQIRKGNFGCLVDAEDQESRDYSPSWWLAFRAAGQLVVARTLVSPESVQAIAAQRIADPEAISFASSDGVLASALRFDRHELLRWCDVFDTVRRNTPTPEASLAGQVANSWQSLLEGNASSALEVAQTVAHDAVPLGAASIAIEAVALEGLALLSLDRVPEALGAARRASRMARTEGILQREYLANLVLARARRFSDQPHAAARILVALSQVAPRPWHSWLGWELLLCQGEIATPDGSQEPPAFDAGVHGSDLFRSAKLGDREGFKRAALQLADGLHGFADLYTEAQAIVAALDPHTSSDDAPEPIRAWFKGDERRTPPALRGLAIPHVDRHGEEVAAVFAIAHPDRPGRLVLGRGLGLLQSGELIDASRFNLARGRTYTALAVLSLAVDHAMSDEDLFQAVYAFPYVTTKHQSTLRVLIHRMRKESGDAAQIVRNQGKTALQLRALLAIPDPRCTPTTEELILRSLAAQGGRATLRQLALALSLSPRTVQRAIRTIVDDGACQTVGAGPETGYEFEDTTFHQPTLTRLRHRSTNDTGRPAPTSITSMLVDHFDRFGQPPPLGKP